MYNVIKKRKKNAYFLNLLIINLQLKYCDISHDNMIFIDSI